MERLAQPLEQVRFLARLRKTMSLTKLPQLRNLEPSQLYPAWSGFRRVVFG